MLTDSELDDMRATATQALPGTAVIQSYASTSDGGGGHTNAWSSAGAVACRVAPEQQSEGEEGERLTSEQRFVVTLPHDAPVSVRSRLLIGGDTYSVTGVDDRSWNVTTRVHVIKEV